MRFKCLSSFPLKRVSLINVPNCTNAPFCRHASSFTLAHTVYEPPGPESGLPFLITHGLLGSKSNWNSIAKATAKASNRKVVAFDARNHGDSPHTPDITYGLMAKDILNLVKHLNIQKFSLMGHSMGGRTVMTFALKYPEMLERLVVVDVSPLELNSHFNSMKVFLQALHEVGENVLKGAKMSLSEARKATDVALKAVVNDPAVRAFLLTNLAEQNGKIVWKPNLDGLIKNFDEIGKFPRALLSTKYDKPVLFIRGQKSTYIPDSHFPGIQETFTRAQFQTVENAGHWPHAENTTKFMNILLPYIKP